MTPRTAISTSILVLGMAFAGLASANISTGSIGTDVQSAVSDGHVSVNVNDGVATLFGVVESRVDANAAEQAAASFDGVDKVISHISVSN